MKSNQVFKAEKFRIYSKFKHSSWRWEEDNTITICRLSNNFNSEIFKLNQPAAILYYYCNGKHTLDELIKKLEKVMVKFNFKLFNHFIKILIKKKLIILGKSKFDINPVGGNIKINKINKQNFKIIDFFKEFNKHKGKGKLLRFKKPVRALFTLNFSCNLKCRGCVQNSFDSNQDFRKISISKKKAIKIIDKLINEKFLFISFMGGEIFVRNDIFDIIKYCKEHGMLVMAITNATLLNKKNISQLAKIGLDGFNIGFDSMKSDINNYSKDSTLFQKMLNNILIINQRKENFVLHLVCTINNKNCFDIIRLYFFCLQNKVRNLGFFFHIPSDKINKKIDINEFSKVKSHFYFFIIKILNKYLFSKKIMITHSPLGWCHYKSSMMAINPEGKLDFCGMFNCTFGSIEKNSIKEIWNSKKMLEIINYENYAFPCSNCYNLKKCAGSCRALVYNVTNNPLSSVGKYCLSGRLLVLLKKLSLIKPRKVKISTNTDNIIWFE